MGSLHNINSAYEDWRDEELRKRLERQQKMLQLENERKSRQDAEAEAVKKPLKVEMGERIHKLKNWLPSIQAGQIDEPSKTLICIGELLEIVDFLYQQMYAENDLEDKSAKP